MSTTVTMRPRRLSTPAISWDDSGTRVKRSGMNTSCTREIGRPNSWPPITAVTYSTTAPSMVSVLLVIALSTLLFEHDLVRKTGSHFSGSCSCRAPKFGGLFLERRDQAGPVELGDIVVEAGL